MVLHDVFDRKNYMRQINFLLDLFSSRSFLGTSHLQSSRDAVAIISLNLRTAVLYSLCTSLRKLTFVMSNLCLSFSEKRKYVFTILQSKENDCIHQHETIGLTVRYDEVVHYVLRYEVLSSGYLKLGQQAFEQLQLRHSGRTNILVQLKNVNYMKIYATFQFRSKRGTIQ